MPVTDTIADFITRIRNAGQARHKIVLAPASKLNFHIANILSDQGFIGEVSSVEEDNQKFIKVGHGRAYNVTNTLFLNHNQFRL